MVDIFFTGKQSMPLTLILNDNSLKGCPEGAMRKILESVR
jgi:hypothetical protein